MTITQDGAAQLAAPWPGVNDHPHIDEIRERHATGGLDAITSMPSDWWIELGAIGNLDDVLAHAAAMQAAGTTELAFFPGPTVEATREDLDAVATIRAAFG